MKIGRCINPACGRLVKNPKFFYSGEVVCKACWARMFTSVTYGYRYAKRQERRLERSPTASELSWRWLAKDMAFAWAKIRQSLDVRPAFPAGIAYFMWEVFDVDVRRDETGVCGPSGGYD